MANKRQLWFVTRPERDPAFHPEALKALKKAVGDFPVKWSGERDLHKEYERVLGDEGYKRKNVSRDGSGGRTWAAMLRTYNYVYLSEGYLHLTKVGEALLNGENTKANITKQILNLQIPNDYYLSSMFRPKFDDDFEIRPARFLVRLILEDKLSNYVTKEEITYFCLPAKKDKDIQEVKEKILNYRKSSISEKERIKEDIANKFDTRRRADHAQRDFEASYSDISNTFMILVDYTSLATYIRGEDLRIEPDKKESTREKIMEYEDRYAFNYRYRLSSEAFAENAGLDVTRYKANPYFNIGPATRQSKNLLKAKNLLSDYPNISSLSETDIITILEKELTLTDAEKIASELHQTKTQVINQDFFDKYLNENNDYEFERKTAEIIRAFGFKVDYQPTPSSRHYEGDGTEIEILVHIDNDNICIIDAKNYAKNFPLSTNLANYMASEYIPIYQNYEGKKVRYFGYITANGFSGSKNLLRVKDMAEKDPANVPIDGTMIDGNTLLSLLDFCLNNDYTDEEKKEAFLSLFTNSGYSSFTKLNLPIM